MDAQTAEAVIKGARALKGYRDPGGKADAALKALRPDQWLQIHVVVMAWPEIQPDFTPTRKQLAEGRRSARKRLIHYLIDVAKRSTR